MKILIINCFSKLQESEFQYFVRFIKEVRNCSNSSWFRHIWNSSTWPSNSTSTSSRTCTKSKNSSTKARIRLDLTYQPNANLIASTSYTSWATQSSCPGRTNVRKSDFYSAWWRWHGRGVWLFKVDLTCWAISVRLALKISKLSMAKKKARLWIRSTTLTWLRRRQSTKIMCF